MMRGQRGSRSAPTLPELRRDRDRRRAVLASIRAADDVLETDLQSDEILACFEEALGERQPEMGTDAAAGREANAERECGGRTATGGCRNRFVARAGDGAFSRERGHARRVACGWDASRDGSRNPGWGFGLLGYPVVGSLWQQKVTPNAQKSSTFEGPASIEANS
ncbi:hypothetical protein EMIHUDRAFT_230069 [Emiliania huxleyi CCMP1516]|uniref:Uncharacterized protein n=2 Tax=Emiliania huxleyi TaxID=2903 RepID=A0A0D3KBD6_EMIH1|nr:hypothetical protein EMIHUDRAFT_230069 [Emiliania huxleyi CCMP1516]EOD33071.1 hypothetical protein EMIHUDRAFT_230069 [Emiliania huxleyi CCMP1516]|eukprot:XP_005785500.1 hypothetical protein EMIHUDRAFT_230069 [Emiliania huxleyi CCMP1516]